MVAIFFKPQNVDNDEMFDILSADHLGNLKTIFWVYCLKSESWLNNSREAFEFALNDLFKTAQSFLCCI